MQETTKRTQSRAMQASGRRLKRSIDGIISRKTRCDHALTRTYEASVAVYEGYQGQVLEGGSVTLCIANRPWCRKVMGSVS